MEYSPEPVGCAVNIGWKGSRCALRLAPSTGLTDQWNKLTLGAQKHLYGDRKQ